MPFTYIKNKVLPEDRAQGNTQCQWRLVRERSMYRDSLLSICQEVSKP